MLCGRLSSVAKQKNRQMFSKKKTNKTGENIMQKYANCPICGTKLLKADEVKNLELQCHKCKEFLIVEISTGGIEIIIKPRAALGYSDLKIQNKI